jgi:aminoglycoside phosphotransferase (APT) family kinase protein
LRDEPCRKAIAALAGELDADAASAVWHDALAAPEWSGAPVLLHADLDARNLLVTDGRLSGLLDFGTLAVGDPAADVMVAWKMLTLDARELFRRELAVDEATWTRARGLALSQAVIALAYYTMETNPVLVREARNWLAEVLADWPA